MDKACPILKEVVFVGGVCLNVAYICCILMLEG